MVYRYLFAAVLAVAVAVTAVAAPEAPGQAPLAAGEVTLNGRPILTIASSMLSLTPMERARIVSQRLETLAGRPLAAVQSIRLDDAETTTSLVAGDLVIITVTDRDAADRGMERRVLAAEYAERIKVAVAAHKEQYDARTILVSVLEATGVTLVLILLLVLLNRAVHGLSEKIVAWKGSRIPSIRFQSIELLHEDRITKGLLAVLRFGRLVVMLGLLYLAIPLVLSFFPRTAGISAALFEYVKTPLVTIWRATVESLPNVVFVVVVVVITRYLLRFVRFLFVSLEKKRVVLPGFYADWAPPSYKIARFLIIAFAVVVIFPYLPGSESPAFKGVSVFLGVLFSFGSTSAVSNIVAGVILTYTRAFTLGDRVKISDTVGDVVEKNLLVTRIRTIKNVDITVPNSMVMGSHIINYSSSVRQTGLILNATVTLGYEVPWRRVHELLTGAARATDRIMADPPPFVFQTALNDFAVSYELNAYTDEPCVMDTTYSDLYARILDRFNEAGIELMTPHHTALRDGNTASIPQECLPGEREAGAHRIRQV